MSATLASLSDNFVYAATAVFALAMLGHAAEWAFARERRTAELATRRLAARDLAGVVAAGDGSVERPVGGPRDGTVDVPVDALTPEAVEEPPAAPDRAVVFGRIGIALTILATALLGAGVVARGLAAERVPWSNLYEFATTGTFIVAVVYLLLVRRMRLSWLGLPLTGFVLVVLGIAIAVLYVPVGGLIPALQSYWLVIHVSAAVLATGVFTVGAVASLLQILKAREERRIVAGVADAGSGYLARLPSSEAIDRVAYRLHAFAFPVWTFALIAGAIWAAAAWGRYWGWDPKETWMFITWVCYAAYLHARSTAGWRRRVPWVALAAYGALLFNLIGVNFVISGLHSYAGI